MAGALTGPRGWRSRWNAKTATWLGLAALTLVGYGLRQYGAQSSINYIPDTQIIREALDIGQGLAGGRLFNMNLGSSLKYPLTLPYFLLGVYGLIFAGGFVTRALPNIHAFIDFLFLQRETVHLISVAGLNIINAAAIPLAFVADRGLDKRHSGWLAAGLVAFDLLLVQFSHQARPHAPLATFLLLAVMLLTYIAEGRGGWRATLAASVACALAIGTLQTGVGVVVPFGLVWLGRLWQARTEKRLGAELRLFFVNAVVLVGVSLILYPTAISDVLAVAQGLLHRSGPVSLSDGEHTVDSGLFRLTNIGRVLVRFWSYAPVTVLLMPVALVYFVMKFWKRPRLLAAALPVPLGNLAIWITFFAASRYWGDMSLFIDVLCAYFLEELLRWAATRWRWSWPVLAVGVGVGVLGISAVQAGRMTYVLSQTDTRSQASQWITSHLPPNSAVMANFQLLELIPDRVGLQRQDQDFPGTLGTYNQWLLQQSADQYPKGPTFEIVDYGLYWPKTEADEVAFVQQRQLGYIVFQTTGNSFTTDYSLHDFATAYGEPVAVFCPQPQWGPTYLPTDIYALAGQVIWNAERPGPLVVVYKLGSARRPPSAPLACH